MGPALCQRSKCDLSASREENNAGKCILEGLGDEGSGDILAQVTSGPIDGHGSHIAYFVSLANHQKTIKCLAPRVLLYIGHLEKAF